MTISNINYGLLVKDLLCYPLHKIYAGKLNWLLLEMLRAYNTTKESGLLYACIQLGTAILLDNQQDAFYYFSQFSEDEKEEFLDYPIADLSPYLSGILIKVNN